MVELGDLMYDYLLVVAVTESGIPLCYYNIIEEKINKPAIVKNLKIDDK